MANLRANNLFGESGQDSNGSAVFDGSNHLTAANAAAFRLNQGSTENFTMEAWIYVTGDTFMRIGRIYETSGNQRSYDFYLSSDLEIKFNYSSNGTAGGVSTLTGKVIAKNEWVHVAIAHEVSTTTLRLFQNGLNVATDNSPHTTYYANTTSNFTLGESFVGNISNFHITKSCKYTGDFIPSKEPIEEDSNTTVLCLNSRFNPLSDDKSNTFTQTSDGAVEASTFIPFDRADSGNVFNGLIKHNTQGYMYFPTGRTVERGRGRGFYMLGYFGTPSASTGKRIDYINIQSQGNSIRFGDLTTNRYSLGSGASSTRGLFTGGYQDGLSPDTDVNAIEFITIATEGNATDFGDRTQVGRTPACASNETRCVMASAFTPSGYLNVIDFVTTATIGNATDFGDLSSGRGGMSMACNSTTRGIFSGGYAVPANARVNTMEFVTIASAGNAQDFGDLTDDSQATSGGTIGNNTRGLIALGYVHPAVSNVINFCTIATTGNAQDFGDLSQAKQSFGSCSNSIRGAVLGGQTPSYTNTIDMVIVATTGNATDFGDVNVGVTAIGAANADSHGGLS